jgi:hypothetical protein
MRAYLLTSGVIFVLVTLAHFARMYAEPHVLKEPAYLLLTVLTAAMSVWAGWLWRRTV